MRSMTLFFFVAVAWACVAEEASDVPVLTPEFGEKAFLCYPKYPTIRMWKYRETRPSDLMVYTTQRSVGPESGLLLHLPAGGKPGEVLAMDVGIHPPLLNEFKGLCFWFKGDGGPGQFTLGTNWNQQVKTNPVVGSFPLKQTEWKKVFIPFDKFSIDVSQKGFYYLNFKLTPVDKEEMTAFVSRVHLYKEEKTEQIKPVDAEDPAGYLPAAKFVLPSLDAAQALIPKTLAKLKAQKPVTIVACGDSITAGAQLGYTKKSYTEKIEGWGYTYTSQLEQRLAKVYGYDAHRFIHKMWVAPKGGEAKFEIKMGVTPEEIEKDKTLAFQGLQVIGVGAGGKQTQFGLDQLAEATMYKPDLVIWAYGANNATNFSHKAYVEPTQKALAALKEQGIEIVLATVTPQATETDTYYNNSLKFRPMTLALAEAEKIACVDWFAGYNARGKRYIGDLFSDTVHPNEFGHGLMAALLSAVLGDKEAVIWDHPALKPKEAR